MHMTTQGVGSWAERWAGQLGGEVGVALRAAGREEPVGDVSLRKPRMPLEKIRDPTGFH